MYPQDMQNNAPTKQVNNNLDTIMTSVRGLAKILNGKIEEVKAFKSTAKKEEDKHNDEVYQVGYLKALEDIKKTMQNLNLPI
ncbi:MAG: hypothetical protein MJZ34_05115 [Paludibacteraceae bacterium]|nr:hypothetical protein [Paludibacteraceae bacterium]